MSSEPLREDIFEQLPLIEPTIVIPQDKSVSYYSFKEVKNKIQPIIEKHRAAIEQALPTLRRREIPAQALTLFGRFLEKKQRDALALSFEIRALTKELVKKNTSDAFYLRYVEEKKLFLALGYRSFKDYTQSYFSDLEYSYLTRLKRISYLSPQEIKTFEPLGSTKMMLLAQLNKEQREDVLEKRFPTQNNQHKTIEDMTTRELRKVVQKERNPSYQNNLIKGVPAHLLHQLRLLEENLTSYQREDLVETKNRLEQVLNHLNHYLKS